MELPKGIIILAKLIFICSGLTYCETKEEGFNITFIPENTLQIPDGESRVVQWVLISEDPVANVTFHFEDIEVSEIAESNVDPEKKKNGDGTFTSEGNFTIYFKFIGINDITVKFLDTNGQELYSTTYNTTAIVSYQLANIIFTQSVTVISILFNFNMGATLDLQVIKQIAVRPIGPILGMFCQFIVMPVLAFTVGLTLFSDPYISLGLFLGGCCPGGGGSNMYTLLLGGSLDLSIMMTFCSSVLAFAFVPLWVLTLGPVILAGEDFQIPYLNITLIVIGLVIPLLIGLAIQFWFPRAKAVMDKTLSPLALFNVLFTFSFGIYANRYIFSYMDWATIIAGICLPWIGYMLGMLLAFIFRMPFKDIITIGIETGLQNMIIALIILKNTLGSPMGDIAFVVPATVVITTPIPLFIAIFIRFMYLKYYKKSPETDNEVKGKDNLGMEKTDESIEKNPPIETITEKKGIENKAADLNDIPT